MKNLLDQLTDEYWANRRILQSDGSWGPTTYFYADQMRKITIKGSGVRKATLRKELWHRLKGNGWCYLIDLKIKMKDCR